MASQRVGIDAEGDTVTEHEQSFGERLRRLRELAGLSQEALAERAGLSTNAISALERGERRRPYLDTIRRLSDALELDAQTQHALAAAARPPKGPPVTQHAAPLPATATIPAEPDVLIGREHDIEALRGLLLHTETWLLTLTGPGGIGKTRIALRLAREVSDEFPDGIGWVDLAPIADPALVIPAIGKALGVPGSVGEDFATSVSSFLAGRRMLIVLDNAEHVRDAAAEIAGVYGGVHGIKVLATSRAPLNIRGEQEYVVPPLPLPPADRTLPIAVIAAAPSVQMLLRGSQRKDPRLLLDAENAAAIRDICRKLEGVPLAMELAAARLPLLGAQDLLRKLDDALPLLTGGKRDAPSRQQTMESTILWSYDLLPMEDQRLFRLLAVFSGGWTIDAAEAVIAAVDPGINVVQGLASLTDHNLVRRIDLVHGRARFGMLGTFREFARLHLAASGEQSRAVQAHLAWISRLVSEAEPHLTGPAQDYWLDLLGTELDNVRAALSSTLETADGERLALAASFWRFWYMRGYFAEGRALLATCIGTPGNADNEILANALNGAGILAQESGNFPEAEACFQRALELRRKEDENRGLAATLSNLGLLADHRGDYETAISLFEESLAICRRVDHQIGIGNALNNLGLVYRDTQDLVRAKGLHEQSLDILRRVGDQRGSANALNNLGNIAIDMGDLRVADRLHQESLQIRRRLQDHPGIAMSLKNLGIIARLNGDIASAAELYRESLLIRQQQGDTLGAIPTLGEVAILADATGNPAPAVRIVAAIRALRNRLGAPPPPAAAERHATIMQRASDMLPSDVVEEEARSGASMRADEVVVFAIEFLTDLASGTREG